MEESKGEDHGLEGVLLAACQSPCKIPFDCPSHFFEGVDGGNIVIEIQQGVGKQSFVTDEIQDNSDPEVKCIIEYNDGVIIGEINELVVSKITQIAEHIISNASLFYGETVTHTHLYFGILDDNSIILLSNSTISTTEFEPNDHILDDEDSDHLVRKRSNEKIYSFIEKQIQKKYNPSRCCSKSKECGNPSYRIPLYNIILFNCRKKFPKKPTSEVYRAIQISCDDYKKPIACCVKCYHLYTSMDRCLQHDKKPEAISFDVSPQPFQALAPSEIAQEGRSHQISSFVEKEQPHSLVLNIINSPYNLPAFNPPSPPQYITYKPRSTDASTMPKWVLRMTGDEITKRGKTSLSVSHVKPHPIPELKPLNFQTRPSSALVQVPKLYGKSPFNRSCIDPRRKKKIHNTPSTFTSRFP